MSVPPMNSFTSHLSFSKGMEPHDAMSLLEKLSGISDCETKKVAQVLDYQPLALATAATYVRVAQQNRANFGWSDYLKRFEEGQRGATANIFIETNQTYPKSMTEVLEIAVQEAMESTNVVLKHTVTLLSLCAAQPLNLEIAVNYICNVEIDLQDEENIRMQIRRCPLLLFDEEESGVYIRVHQVTHDSICRLIKAKSEEGELLALNATVEAMFKFLKDNNELIGLKKFYSREKGRHIELHASTLMRKIGRFEYLKEDISEVAGNDIYKMFRDLHTKAMALFISVKGDLLAIEYHDGLSGLCILV